MKNIEKLIELGYEITIEKVRYGTGYYIAFDSSDLSYKPFAELLEGIIGFDDLAVKYMLELKKIEAKYPDYPVVHTETLKEGFSKIDDKAAKWCAYNFHESMVILDNIVRQVKMLAEHWE